MTLGELRGNIGETIKCLNTKVKVGLVVGAVLMGNSMMAEEEEVVNEIQNLSTIQKASISPLQMECLKMQSENSYLKVEKDSDGFTTQAKKRCL